MTNNFLTPSIIAKEMLMLLKANTVMSQLIHKDFSKEFVAKIGDTITIRKPATFSVKDFNGSTEDQEISEESTTIVMDKFYDVSTSVTSKEMALSIEDFGEQVLKPIVDAFVQKIDTDILAVASGATSRIDKTDNAVNDIVELRKELQTNKAPVNDRALVVSSNFEASMLKDPTFINADKVGDNGTALREASLGRKFGLNIYADQNADDVANLEALAFHKNAIGMVTRPLETPMGASKVAVESFDGFSLRVVYGYDMKTKTDKISVDMLCGYKLLRPELASVLVTPTVKTDESTPTVKTDESTPTVKTDESTPKK